jgi:hypothetical protein
MLMHDRTRSGHELVEMALNPDPEDRELLRTVGLDFLQQRRIAVETKIRERRERLQRFYPRGQTLPETEEELTQVYQTEKALIEELLQASTDRPFVEVARERRAKANRRVQQFNSRKSNAEARAKVWQAHTEQEILTELLRQWLTWLKT